MLIEKVLRVLFKLVQILRNFLYTAVLGISTQIIFCYQLQVQCSFKEEALFGTK
jgi:hypothetical protein